MKYLIIGGVAGGATVAARLRRIDEKAGIIILEKGEYVSYANCGLPYYIGDTIKNRSELLLRSPESFMQQQNIEVRTGHEVTAIDRENKEVIVTVAATGQQYAERYDKLVLSPGAEPLTPPIPGINNERIFTLRTIPDTDRIKSMVFSGKTKKAVIIGGGFIGLEMAENFTHAGLQVTVIEAANQVMAPLDYSMACLVHNYLREKGIELILEDGVNKFEDNEGEIRTVLKSGQRVASDMVLLSIGVKPDTQLARKAGLTIGVTGGIKVNEYLQTSDESIYALGDAIEVLNPVTGKPARVPLAGPTNKQGRIVANNMVYGNKEKYEGTIGTSIVKLFDMTVATTGSNAKVLKSENIPYLSSFIHPYSHAGYYPESAPISIKILFSPADGRLLGAQIVGSRGVDKRIDLFAQVIKNRGTVYDLTTIEHGYAPPYATAKDAVNVAGYVAENMLNGKMKTIHWRDVNPDDKNVLLIDVRTPEEYAKENIPGSVNIPLQEIRNRTDEISKEKRIILICAAGQRGYVAYRILNQLGFEDIYNLSGGYTTWKATKKQVSGK